MSSSQVSLIHELRHHLLSLGQHSHLHSVAGEDKTRNMHRGISYPGLEVVHITAVIFSCIELSYVVHLTTGDSGKCRQGMWLAHIRNLRQKVQTKFIVS